MMVCAPRRAWCAAPYREYARSHPWLPRDLLLTLHTNGRHREKHSSWLLWVVMQRAGAVGGKGDHLEHGWLASEDPDDQQRGGELGTAGTGYLLVKPTWIDGHPMAVKLA